MDNNPFPNHRQDILISGFAKLRKVWDHCLSIGSQENEAQNRLCEFWGDCAVSQSNPPHQIFVLYKLKYINTVNVSVCSVSCFLLSKTEIKDFIYIGYISLFKMRDLQLKKVWAIKCCLDKKESTNSIVLIGITKFQTSFPCILIKAWLA